MKNSLRAEQFWSVRTDSSSMLAKPHRKAQAAGPGFAAGHSEVRHPRIEGIGK